MPTIGPHTLQQPMFCKIHQSPLQASGFARCVAQGQKPREAKTEFQKIKKIRVGELQNDP